MVPQPPLFQPFRALGYITDEVPFAIQRRGREVYITVSAGKCWQARPAACIAAIQCRSMYNSHRRNSVQIFATPDLPGVLGIGI